MLLSQENTASPCEVGKETGVASDESKPRHSLPSSVSSCLFSAAQFDGGGKESSSPPFLYLPKPGVAWFPRSSAALERQFSPGVSHLTKARRKTSQIRFSSHCGGKVVLGGRCGGGKRDLGGGLHVSASMDPSSPSAAACWTPQKGPLATLKVSAGH